MPIYRYQCGVCRTEFSEVWLSRADAEKNEKETRCPKCGATGRRLIGKVSFRLEDGSGRSG